VTSILGATINSFRSSVSRVFESVGVTMHAWLNQHVRMDTLLKDFGHKTLISGVVQCFLPTSHHQLRNGWRKNNILYVKNCWMCLVVKKLYMQLQISSVLIGMRMYTVDPEITVWVLYSMYLCGVVCSAVTAGMDHKCSWCLLLYLPVSKFLDMWHWVFPFDA
jgi:hypothetical protein